jgi:hypothetical protein
VTEGLLLVKVFIRFTQCEHMNVLGQEYKYLHFANENLMIAVYITQPCTYKESFKTDKLF